MWLVLQVSSWFSEYLPIFCGFLRVRQSCSQLLGFRRGYYDRFNTIQKPVEGFVRLRAYLELLGVIRDSSLLFVVLRPSSRCFFLRRLPWRCLEVFCLVGGSLEFFVLLGISSFVCVLVQKSSWFSRCLASHSGLFGVDVSSLWLLGSTEVFWIRRSSLWVVLRSYFVFVFVVL